jgi:hypothetical protein
MFEVLQKLGKVISACVFCYSYNLGDKARADKGITYQSLRKGPEVEALEFQDFCVWNLPVPWFRYFMKKILSPALPKIFCEDGVHVKVFSLEFFLYK